VFDRSDTACLDECGDHGFADADVTADPDKLDAAFGDQAARETLTGTKDRRDL
jgi:hypothetical protein